MQNCKTIIELILVMNLIKLNLDQVKLQIGKVQDGIEEASSKISKDYGMKKISTSYCNSLFGLAGNHKLLNEPNNLKFNSYSYRQSHCIEVEQRGVFRRARHN